MKSSNMAWPALSAHYRNMFVIIRTFSSKGHESPNPHNHEHLRSALNQNRVVPKATLFGFVLDRSGGRDSQANNPIPRSTPGIT
jgi:hypothetical protein